MKYRLLIICLMLFCCKNDNEKEEIGTSQNETTPTAFWNAFVAEHPQYQNSEQPEAWYFHNNKDDANRLANLVVTRKKQAGSGLYQWYKDANADLPEVGTLHIITNFSDEAKAIIKVVKVDTISFNNISEAYASLDMGTSENALVKWKKAHREFFESSLDESDQIFNENKLVVCEWYETIWPRN